MAALRPVLFVIGVLAILAGLLFTLQGAGVVHWPRSSFMLDQRQWVVRGALVMVVGVVLASRTRPRR